VNQTLEPVRPDLLDASRRLIGLGPRTLGQDLALARSPIWHLVSTTLSVDDLVNPSGPLVRVAGPSLTIGDQRLFAELFTNWARRGFPSDHRVSFGIADLAAALGLQHKGGKQYALVRASLRRLTSAVFADVHLDGRYEVETGAALLAEYQTRSRPGAPACARLNERTAQTLLRHPMTYLDGPTWDAIMARDLLAARLWVWLEGERIRDEWRWSLFPSGREPVVLGLQPPARRTTPIAHLLTIDTWGRRRKIVERIRSAARVVASIDVRYELAVEPSLSDRTNYVLHCRRSSANSRSVLPDVGSEVEAAWHAASPRRRLSAAQLRILRDLIAEWGASRVVAALTTAAPVRDPFARLLDAAASWREERDSAWTDAKAAEQAAASETLLSIQQRRAMAAMEAPTQEGRTDGPTSLRDLLGDIR
jgi:hypothetical protein